MLASSMTLNLFEFIWGQLSSQNTTISFPTYIIFIPLSITKKCQIFLLQNKGKVVFNRIGNKIQQAHYTD